MNAQTQESPGTHGSRRLLALRPIDWAWVGMAYCFFVVFHMLPSYFVTGMFSGARNALAALPGFWIFIGLAYVGFLVGYRSQGVTIVEPGIAGLLYALTLLYFMGQLTGQEVSLRTIGFAYVTVVAIFVTAVMSAWVGEKVQARMEAKRGSSTTPGA